MIESYPIEALPQGFETYAITFQHRNGIEETRYEIVDMGEKVRYAHTPLDQIAGKCAALFLGAQLYGYGYMVWHFARAPLVFMALVIESLGRGILEPSVHSSRKILTDLLWVAPAAFFENIWAAVRTPFYCLAIECVGFYGMFSPLRARVFIGKIEKNWHHRMRRDDLSHSHFSLWAHIWNGLTNKNPSHTIFLAYCMQPIDDFPKENDLPDFKLNVLQMEKVSPAS